MGERKKWGSNTHKTVCRYCGGVHDTKREKRECRDRQGAPPPEPVQRAERRPGSETTHYELDPLKGNKRAHAIGRKLRNGMTPRRVAKHFGISVSEVEEVLTKSVQTSSEPKA